MNEREQKKRPEVTRWVLIGVLLICIAVAAVMQAKADHLINDEPSLTPEALARPADMRVLMLGNSLIYWRSTDVMLERLAASTPGAPRLVVGRIARPSFSLYDHYMELYHTGFLHRLSAYRQAFSPGSEAPRWDAVIIHEQSMAAAGMGIDDEALNASASIGHTLYLNADKHGARLVLMASWGYMHGARPDDDAWTKKHLPDFKVMNQSIDEGYSKMAAWIQVALQDDIKQHGLSTWEPAPIAIARVGRAFAQTWELDAAASRDPLAPGSLFRGLYDDPNHPSLAGAYLSAAVLLVTLTGQPCGAATWVPDGLDPEEARRLRALADAQLTETSAEPPGVDAPPTRPQTTPQK